MNITIDSKLRITNVPSQVLEIIKEELTLDNPEFSKKQRMGISVWGIPRVIKLWNEESVNGQKTYVLPRGYYARLYQIVEKTEAPSTIEHNRLFKTAIVYPGYPQLRDYQRPVVEIALKWQQGVPIMPCGSGKGHPLDTKIYTPDGYTTIGELYVGDKVFGSDGKTIKVTGIYDRGVLPTYKVTFSDNTSILCDEDHIWTVQHYKKRQVDPTYWTNKTTRELLSLTLLKKDGGTMWFIPIVDPVNFKEKEVPIDPYFLGAYLGDGRTSKYTLGFTNGEADIIQKMNKVKSIKRSCFTNYFFVGAQDIMKSLEEMGLRNKKSFEKFIPAIYKYNSADIRLKVLQGLIDTDGEVCKKGCVYRFFSTSKQLIDDTLEIIQSLGGTGKIYSRKSCLYKNGEKVNHRTCYTITFKLTDIKPFTSIKHNGNYQERTRVKSVYRGIKSIEHVGEMPIRCIQVDSKNSLYVAESFIVTHNTEVGMAIAAKSGQPTLWICHTMDLLQQSMDRAISRLNLTGDMVGLIQGKNMKIGTHMTFATVQTLAKRDLSEIKNKFGCIIVDECHLAFKDHTRSRMFESVISQFPAYYRFGLTASEHRSDGLIQTMFHLIGPKFYEIGQDDPRLMTVSPIVEFVETEFDFHMDTEVTYNDLTGEMEKKEEMLNVQQMYQAMREDSYRDNIILKKIAEHKKGDSTLVLGHSLEHLESLVTAISNHFGTEYEYRFVNGGTKKRDRDKAIAEMRDGKADFLFATYQLAKLGLDIPRLNRLVLATPAKDKTTIQQAVGRLMRPCEGKGRPKVYDIWDSSMLKMTYWAKERIKVYRNLNCRILGGPKVRKY